MGSALALLICLGGVGVGMAYNWRILTLASGLVAVVMASSLIIQIVPILIIIVAAVWYYEKKQAGVDPFENFRRTETQDRVDAS